MSKVQRRDNMFTQDRAVQDRLAHIEQFLRNITSDETALGPEGPPGPIGVQGPGLFTWALDGFAVQINQSEVAKDSGTADAWNSGARSLEGHVRGAFTTFRARNASVVAMAGLNSDPATDAGYATIDYAFYPYSTGDLFIYESGVSQGTFGLWNTNTILAITYDGANVRYWKNGEIQRTVARSIGLALHFDSSFYNANAGFRDVHFGPMGESGGGAQPYEHNQATPSSFWTVTHNLGKRPSVSVFTSANDEVEGDVEHLSNTQLTIAFSAPFAGVAYLN